MPSFRFHRVPPGPSSRSDAAGGEVVADAIGGGEVAAAPGRVAILDQPLDLGRVDRRLRVLRRCRSAMHAEHAVEMREGIADAARRRPAPRRAVVDGGVQRRAPGRTSPPAPPTCSGPPASASSNSARARRRAPAAIVGVRPRRPSTVSSRARKSASRRSDFVGLLQRLPREAQLLAVVAREQQVAQRRRPEALIDDVLHVEDVAERLRHLLVVDDQVLDVHPEPRERACRWRLRSARSRSRDAERSGRCRRRGCRSAARPAGAAPSPSTRDASPDGPGPSP